MKTFVALIAIAAPILSTPTVAAQSQYIWPPVFANSQTARADIVSISKDGRYVAMRISPSVSTQEQAWIYDTTTGNANQFQGYLPGTAIQQSANGEQVLFTKFTAGQSTLWIRNLLTNEELQVDSDPTNAYPNSQADVGAPGLRQITDDGSTVVFAAYNFKRFVNVAPNGYNTYAFKPSTGEYALINDPAAGFTGSAPTVSGDGKFILYTSVAYGTNNTTVVRYDVTTGERLTLGTTSQCSANALRINYDGSVAAYTCAFNSAAINIATNERRTIADNSSLVTSISDDGKLFVIGTGLYSWDASTVTGIDSDPQPVGIALLSGNGQKAAWSSLYASTPFQTLYAPKFGDVPTFVPTDTTAPVMTHAITPAPNEYGWNNSPATLAWTVNDPESAIASQHGCEPATVATETSATTYECSATSGGGTTTQQASIKLDMTAPVLATPIWAQNPKPVSTVSTLTVPTTDLLSGSVRAEYFIGDNDPGLGNGASMDIVGTNATAILGVDFPTGVYKISVRAQDRAGNWSDTTSDYLVVYDPSGPKFRGKRSLVPSIMNGDVLPGLISADQKDKVAFGFTVKYDAQGQINDNSDFQLTYSTGNNCKSSSKAQNCHELNLNADNIEWLTTQGINNSIGTFQGTGLLSVDGQKRSVQFRVTGRDGERLDPISPDQLQVQIFNSDDDANTAQPLYVIHTTDIARGNIKLIGQ